MTEALLENFMQLQRKIVDPRDVYDQANGCRGMLLVIEALFRQGKLSQEARDYLHIQYSTLLNTLWMEDLGKEYDKLQPRSPSSATSNPSSNPFPDLKPFSTKISEIVTEEAIRHTLKFAKSSCIPSNVAGSSSTNPRGRPTALPSSSGNTSTRAQQRLPQAPPVAGSLFTTAKSVYAEANPEQYKNDLRNHPELKGIGFDIVQRVLNEMMTENPDTTWEELAGLQYAKNAVREMIVWPLLRPDIFTGAREPPKGMLLFGPPGTGKTLIGKCIAAEAKATFFSVSASTLVSKWIGESNLLVKALFAVARAKQPSVIFLDELDSLLSARRSQDHKHDRQLITELFVQLDGAKTYKENRVIFIGATNRPFDLDDAARRRLVKRLYIALPDQEARAIIIKNLFKETKHSMTEEELKDLAVRTKDNPESLKGV